MNLESLTLAQIASEIRSGKVSPVDYCRALLNQIDRLEPTVQAWVTLDGDRALREATACESEARAGKFRGPLHGIPVGIKDIFYTEGLRTTAGSHFLQDFIPDRDAYCVAQLRKAGAIVLGKAVTTEFATFDAGPTRNPWNPAHTPGGSSSGSAAAVAARMCPAAIGSQTIGSVGRPAAYCGVVGFMPSQARVSRKGAFPVSWSLDHVGGFTRSVGDAHLLLEGLGDASVQKIRTNERVRIGVVRGFFSSKATPQVLHLHETALRKLSDGQFLIDEVKLPDIFDIHPPILMTILRTEISAAHTEFYQKHSQLYSPKLRALVETGTLLDASSYIQALRLRNAYKREMSLLFDRFDVLVSPGAMDTAPEGLHYTGDPAFSGPWALADFPTLTIPCGTASNGMPVSVQVSAAPMNEGLLLGVGEDLETLFAFQSRPNLCEG